jgi:PAS domain S-box-containing protein/diguanylate cyclase (GGDEF)-like protein
MSDTEKISFQSKLGVGQMSPQAALQMTALFIDRAADAILWVTQEAQIRYANEAACCLLGYSAPELLAMTAYDITVNLSSEGWDDFWQTLQRRTSLTIEGWHRTKNSYQLPSEITATFLEFQGEAYACIILRDMSERTLVESALRESEERFRCLVEGAGDAFFLHDLEGQVIDINQQACISLGYSRQELLQMRVQDFEVDFVRNPVWKDLVPGKPVTINGDNRRKDGTTFPVEVRLSAINLAGTTLIVALVRDVTDRQEMMQARDRAEAKLRRYAYYDPLTNLPNYTLFLEHLEQLIQPGNVTDFAVFCLSLERFKAVKYSFGHSFAEQLLISAAQRLAEFLPMGSVLARLEASEFAMLVPNLNQPEAALRLASQLEQVLQAPYRLYLQDVFISVNIGIALSSIDYMQGKDFLQAADTAMHRAQMTDATSTVIFDHAMQVEAVQRIQLDTDLRRALNQQELQVHYQPIVNLQTLHVVGVEALVRWQHPNRGTISPGEFIPLAEETGLIVPLGTWVLQQACLQFVSWQRQFGQNAPEFVSVNLSAIQLAQPDLLEVIDRILLETELHPRHLKLEITESTAMKNPSWVLNILAQLKSRKIQLGIDDFGTGYSSLSLLHSFPVDVLKVDRSFVNQTSVGGRHLEIIQTIITLAQGLGLEVIAEGIEASDQLHYLQSLNCQYGQGYLFSKPATASDIEMLFAGYLHCAG